MFVFTDASAKDDSKSNIDALKAVASSSSSPITFFANLDGCGSGIASFKEIASYTSGRIFTVILFVVVAVVFIIIITIVDIIIIIIVI